MTEQNPYGQAPGPHNPGYNQHWQQNQQFGAPGQPMMPPGRPPRSPGKTWAGGILLGVGILVLLGRLASLSQGRPGPRTPDDIGFMIGTSIGSIIFILVPIVLGIILLRRKR